MEVKFAHRSLLLWDKVIWSLFSIWIIVDDITGYFINAGKVLPISQVFKFGILILLIFRLSIYRRQFIILYSLLIYISFYSVHLILINEDLAISLLHLSKLLLTTVIYCYLVKYLKISRSADYLGKSNKMLLLSFVIIALNILSGIFGIGYHTYPNEKIGYKGFFFAGNEMGGLLVVIFPYILYRAFFLHSIIKYILISALCIVLAVLLGTKTVIIISLLTPIGIAWIYGNKKVRIIIISCVIIVLLVSIPFIINLINSNEFDLLVRLSYSYNNGGLTSLIFSGRDEFWERESLEFFDADFCTNLFGLGGNRTVEMDHLDAMLNYGYIGMCLIYGFIFYLLIHSVKCRHNNSYCPTIILSNMFIIIISLIAGHIIFSSMAGLYIALQNSLVGIKANKPIFIRNNLT